MPPFLALALSLVFTVSVALYDRQRNPKTSAALWIPFLWLTVLGSRAFSLWLSLAPISTSEAQSMAEGNATDRNFYTVLMILGIIVLARRRVSLIEILRKNIWLTIFFVYCGLSLLWSDFPEIASKRWIKAFGDPIMVLVVLTEAHPTQALAILLKRIAYLLLPMSVVFIKYFPELGKDYDPWTGWAFYTGVTTNKNMLGYLLFVFGLLFVCSLIGKFGRNREGSRAIEAGIAVVFLGIIGWLFMMSDSKTPLMSLLVGVFVYLASGVKNVRRYWGTCVVISLVLFTTLQLSLDITSVLIASTGRDLTLTGRTDVWQSVIDLSGSPWFGVGYSSFWLGDRLQKMWDIYFFRPTQAHNGYLEMYINLGWIGVACLVGILVSGYRNQRRRWVLLSAGDDPVVIERDFARFAMAYLVCFLIYNVTEATFYALNFLFVVFLAVAMERPSARAVAGARSTLAEGNASPAVLRRFADFRVRTRSSPGRGTVRRYPAGSRESPPLRGGKLLQPACHSSMPRRDVV